MKKTDWGKEEKNRRENGTFGIRNRIETETLRFYKCMRSHMHNTHAHTEQMEEIAKSGKNECNVRANEWTYEENEQKCVDLNSGQLRSMHLIFLLRFTSSLRSNNSGTVYTFIWCGYLHSRTHCHTHTLHVRCDSSVHSAMYIRPHSHSGCVWICISRVAVVVLYIFHFTAIW